ncbi:MAG: hypothetical protein PWR03_1266 [Tenuifilum sp.]|nr:hypothetical protein [Tenuifilum sp.]
MKCSSYLPSLLERIEKENKQDFINWLVEYKELLEKRHHNKKYSALGR